MGDRPADGGAGPRWSRARAVAARARRGRGTAGRRPAGPVHRCSQPPQPGDVRPGGVPQSAGSGATGRRRARQGTDTNTGLIGRGRHVVTIGNASTRASGRDPTRSRHNSATSAGIASFEPLQVGGGPPELLAPSVGAESDAHECEAGGPGRVAAPALRRLPHLHQEPSPRHADDPFVGGPVDPRRASVTRTLQELSERHQRRLSRGETGDLGYSRVAFVAGIIGQCRRAEVHGRRRRDGVVIRGDTCAAEVRVGEANRTPTARFGGGRSRWRAG